MEQNESILWQFMPFLALSRWYLCIDLGIMSTRPLRVQGISAIRDTHGCLKLLADVVNRICSRDSCFIQIRIRVGIQEHFDPCYETHLLLRCGSLQIEPTVRHPSSPPAAV